MTMNDPSERSKFIGGSDARVLMGKDEKALARLWREKRGEALAVDFSDVLVVQLGLATEDLNRGWFERQSGRSVTAVQKRIFHRTISFMAATLDGLVVETQAVFEGKFMLPWTFSEEDAAAKHMAQLQHNMLVAETRSSILSIITGGGKWVCLEIAADPLYQTVLLSAEKAFWRAVQTGEPPHLWDAEPPRPKIEAVKIVNMSSSNSWAQFAELYCATHQAHSDHEYAKTELKTLMPEDAREAVGHGLRGRRSKSGSVSFDLTEGPVHAAL